MELDHTKEATSEPMAADLAEGVLQASLARREKNNMSWERNQYVRRITIYQDKKGEYRWRMQAWNNKIIADSAEGYKSHQGATVAAKKLIKALEGSVMLLDNINNSAEYCDKE